MASQVTGGRGGQHQSTGDSSLPGAHLRFPRWKERTRQEGGFHSEGTAFLLVAGSSCPRGSPLALDREEKGQRPEGPIPAPSSRAADAGIQDLCRWKPRLPCGKEAPRQPWEPQSSLHSSRSTEAALGPPTASTWFLEQTEISTTNIRQRNTTCCGYAALGARSLFCVCVFKLQRHNLVLVTGPREQLPRHPEKRWLLRPLGRR